MKLHMRLETRALSQVFELLTSNTASKGNYGLPFGLTFFIYSVTLNFFALFCLLSFFQVAPCGNYSSGNAQFHIAEGDYLHRVAKALNPYIFHPYGWFLLIYCTSFNFSVGLLYYKLNLQCFLMWNYFSCHASISYCT